MKQYLLGIDVGTTGTKTILFSEDGARIGSAYRPYDLLSPKVGQSEQDPEDWWRAIVETVRESVPNAAIGQNIAAISLSLQGGTVVPVDASFTPLRPAIVWNDARCEAEREAFIRQFGDARVIYEKTGWELDPGLPVLQILHMKEHEPEIFDKAAMFLTVPDYVSAKMTGIPAVDPSDAGINQFYNIREGKYDAELLAFAGIRESQLAKVVRSGEAIGKLTAKAAAELGISENAVLVAGAHDQYAVALGAGATKAGDILIGSGTAWVVTAIGDEPDFSGSLAQSVAAIPGKWGSLLSLSSGGVSLEWWRRKLTVQENGEKIPFPVIDKEAEARHAADDGLFFYPFSGKCKDGADFSKGTLIGLDLSHDRFDIAAAIMEGVVFQAVWMMESFKVKPSADGLKLAGGASKSPIWTKMLANIANLPVRIPEVADLACVGAAVLAGVGCGLYKDAEDGYEKLAIRETVVYPDADEAARYAKYFDTYKKNAEALGKVYGI